MSLRLARPMWSFGLAIVLCLAGCSKDAGTDVTGPGGDAGASTVSADATSKAKSLVEEAIALIQNRQFSTAVQKLNQAIEADKSCAEAFFQRAGILADAGQDRLAMVDYGKAIDLNGKEVRYLNMRGLFLLTRRQHDQALEDFTAAIAIDANYVQAHNNRGLVHLAKSDFTSAVADFDKAVSLDPKYVDGFNNRGFAWYQAGANEKALADFNKSLQLNPKYVNAFNNRAMLMMRLQKYRDAVNDFTSAIALDENNAKHYQNRRTAFLELGMQKQAEADGDKIAWLVKLNEINNSITRSPNEPKNYIQRASHFAKAGRSEVALANYEAAIKVAPDSCEAYVSRASYHLEQGELQQAIADCTAALDKKWSHHALSLRGDAYFQMERFDEAINDYTSAKRLDSTVAEAYLRRSQQRQNRGNLEGARADLEVAQRLDPAIGQ